MPIISIKLTLLLVLLQCSAIHCFPFAIKTKATTSASATEEGPAKSVTNHKWILARRPNGNFDPQKDVELVSEKLVLEECEEDEIMVETDTLSVDAFIRTMLDADAYHGSVPLEGTIPAIGYGKVIHIGSGTKKKHKVGSLVQGMLGAQTFAKVKAAQTTKKSKGGSRLMPQTASLGLMGLTTGLTAYTGIFHVLKRPRKGETVVVTGAAGAVGSLAAQLAKSTGARVIGIAGGTQKQDFLENEINLDGSINYKHPKKSVSEQLEEVCPNGIDFIYDNVGGQILDDLLFKINPKGRVVICGAISQYNSGDVNNNNVQGPSNYLKLAERGATMKGFNVMQYMSKMGSTRRGLIWLHLRGKIVMKEQVYKNGIDSFPLALNDLLMGGNIGKSLVKVKETTTKADEKAD